MKKKILTVVKYCNWLYKLYFYIGNFFVGILKIFVKTNDKLILFNSFGGKKYDDSPKVIYEAMIKDARFKDFEFIWAFHEPNKHNVKGAKIIKSDTFTYFKTALKARCWITNSGIERALDFKGKKVFYFNTWHGTPIKRIGNDINLGNKGFRSKGDFKVDIMVAQGEFEAEIFSKAFNIQKNKFLLAGLPRNDKLVHYTQEEVNELKKKLNLPLDKKIILYAPTFREYEKDGMNNCVLKPPMDIDKWERNLKDKFCLLFRAHYEVSKIMNVRENYFIRNMTTYSNLEELMIVADILISDYSSIFFDFSVMDKVMLHFTYDYDLYSQKRGMYFDIRNYLNGADNEDRLIEMLQNLIIDKEKERSLNFRREYVNYFGNATEQCLECIINNIGE